MVSYAKRVGRVTPSAIRELLRHGADPGIISFGGGYPDPALFPMAALNGVYADLLTGDPSTLQYCQSDGLPRLREQVAARLSGAGTPCTADEVLITQGAQQGIDLTARLVLDPGDTVVTENPTFVGALIAFNPYEPTYAPVRIDDDGLDVDHLEQVLTGSPGAKLLYTVPDFQNPTGVTLGLDRRHRLVDLANRFDLVVLEDTPYRELRYDGDPLPTLKSLDTEGRVIHLGSFSKVLAPGLRLGWAVADKDVVEKLGLLKLAADTQTSTLNMAAASAYLDRHDLDAHIGTLRVAYRAKRDVIVRAIADAFPSGVERTTPRGGLFTWVSFPEGFDTTAFLRDSALPLAKVAYVPGATFFPGRQETRHARFSFSGLSEDKITEGIARVAALLAG